MMTPHDAEEAMRPYLLAFIDAEDGDEWDTKVLNAAVDALDKALELLGLQR